MTLVEIEGDSLIVVDAEAAIELQSDLADRNQAVFRRRDRHAGARVGVDDAGGVVPRHVDGAVDDEPRGVHAEGAVADLGAVDVDLHQGGGGDLLPAMAVGIDEEMTGLAGHANRRVGIDEVGHLVMREETIAGRELHPLLPFRGSLLEMQAGDGHRILLVSVGPWFSPPRSYGEGRTTSRWNAIEFERV